MAHHGKSKPWPQEHDGVLRELVTTGNLSYREIAIEINRRFATEYTRNAVIGRAGRMGLYCPVAKRSPAEIQAGRDAARLKRRDRDRRRRHTSEPVRLRPPQEQIAERVARIDTLDIALIDLEPDHCRYPKGEGLGATYCGHPVFARSYCAPHYFHCHTSSERAATDISKRVREAV